MIIACTLQGKTFNCSYVTEHVPFYFDEVADETQTHG
jgi:hypothetical protein